MQAEQMQRCPNCRAKVPACNPELPHTAYCPECGCEIAAGKPAKNSDQSQRMPLVDQAWPAPVAPDAPDASAQPGFRQNAEATQASSRSRADGMDNDASGPDDGEEGKSASPEQKTSGWITTVLWVVITVALLGWKAYSERKAPTKPDRPTKQERQYPSRP